MHKHSQNIILQRDCCEASLDISLHKDCTNAIYGTIFNMRGEAINNATIKLVDQNLNPIMHTITSNDGSYVLVPHCDDFYQLIIAKSGFTTLLIKTITFNQPMNFTLNKVRINYCDVIGNCFYDDGTLAEDVVVTIDKETTNKKVIPDRYGSFAFLQMDCGLHKLEISGQTCEPYKAYFEIYDSDKLINLNSICLAKKDIGCTIHGIIKDQNGIVLSNVLVLLYCSFCKKFVMRTYTNKDGIYFFGNLEKGSYYIKAIY